MNMITEKIQIQNTMQYLILCRFSFHSSLAPPLVRPGQKLSLSSIFALSLLSGTVKLQIYSVYFGVMRRGGQKK